MSLPKWTSFVQQCLLQRVDGDEFQDMAGCMIERHHVTGQALLGILIRCRGSFCPVEDPLIPLYIRALVTLGLAQISEVLLTLIQIWNQSSSRKKEEQIPGIFSRVDAAIVADLATTLASNEHREALATTRTGLILSSRWLLALMKWLSEISSRATIHPVVMLIEAVGSLVAGLASSDNGMVLLANKDKSEPRESVKRVLDTCQPYMATVSMQLHGRLDAIQKDFDLFSHIPTSSLVSRSENATQIDPLRFESTILDGIHTATRTGLFVFFNAALCGRPLIDDHKIISFLNARYAGEHYSMFNDLIVAHFDVLAAVVLSEKSQRALRLCRSCLTNKLPPLLSLVAESSLEAISSEQCLSQALQQVDSEIASILPTTKYSAQHISLLRDIRQEFLLACQSHKLISATGVTSMLGVSPIQKQPMSSHYLKDDLVQQIRTNHSRADRLIGEVGMMQGNAGHIVQALIEVMHRYCQNKETAPLKELCTLIVRKPDTIEIMTLFSPVAYILSPLCALLDGWKWDDLHGESQPVYDEFGGILLLILTFRYRLNLTSVDLGARSSSSFVRRLVESNFTNQNINEMDEETSKHLGDWISALFIAEQLSDELTSSCSPQDYYLLVPALCSQSLEACESGKLSLESLKSGFEYLLEPFLLPSLIIAIIWLMHNIWELGDPGNAAYSIQLVQALTKTPTSSEARAIHKTILTIVAEPLNQLLESSSGSRKTNPDLTALFASIQPHSEGRYTNTATKSDIESWTSGAGGMLGSIRNTFRSLLYWDTSLIPSTRLPTSFSYMLIDTAVLFNGAADVLRVLIDELKLLSGTPNFDSALDILSSAICARTCSLPEADFVLNLRETLRLEYDNLAQILKHGDLIYAEAVVRLRRRVEILSVVPPQADISFEAVSGPLVPELTNMDLQNMNLDANAANADIDVTALQNAAQAHPEDIDRMLDEAAAAPMMNEADFGEGGLDVGDSMDDIFAGLTDPGSMGNFDDLDMEGMF